jgi:hypothetical protein
LQWKEKPPSGGFSVGAKTKLRVELEVDVGLLVGSRSSDWARIS